MNSRPIAGGFGLRGLLFVTLLATACSNLETPRIDGVEPATASIVDGTRENGRNAVVFVYRLDGAACTGAIISPRVVLTALHCVTTGSSVASADNFAIVVGNSIQSRERFYRVSEVHPVALGRGANDVALLVLADRAVEEPYEIARENPRTIIGEPATAVGYGQTPSSGAGVKYTTATTVDAVMEGFLLVPPTVCSGDSGGPLLGPDNRVWGVASFIYSPDGRTSPRCGTAPGAYNEIFRHLDVIDEILAETGTCVPTAEEACNGEDDDCDEVIDEGCLSLGTECTTNEECVGGLCAETSAGRVCTVACDPLRPGLGCESGFYCDQTTGCSGHCVPGERGEGGIGADCSSDSDCANLNCINPGDGRQRCLDPCRGDAGLCLVGEACAASPGQCGGCVDADILRAARGLGEPCELDTECREGWTCYEYGGAGECASPCGEDDSCADGFACVDDLCVRARDGGIGGACLSNRDCGDGICAAQGERAWCTVFCNGEEESCPDGFVCTEAGGAQVCAPERSLDGESCAANPDCVSGLCVPLGAGERVCASTCDGRNACSPGFECHRTSDPNTSVCLATVETDGGGCTVGTMSTRRRLPVIFVLIGVLAVVWRVGRRRR